MGHPSGDTAELFACANISGKFKRYAKIRQHINFGLSCVRIVKKGGQKSCDPVPLTT